MQHHAIPSITPSEQQQLLQRFRPCLVFQSTEQFFPSTVEYYLANAEMTDSDGRLVRAVGSVYTDSLQSHSFSNYHVQVVNEKALKGFSSIDLPVAPFYGTVECRASTWVLQYLLFFPYRGSKYCCGFFPISCKEEACFKFIHIVVSQENQQILGVYLDGCRVDISDCILTDGHTLNKLTKERIVQKASSNVDFAEGNSFFQGEAFEAGEEGNQDNQDQKIGSLKQVSVENNDCHVMINCDLYTHDLSPVLFSEAPPNTRRAYIERLQSNDSNMNDGLIWFPHEVEYVSIHTAWNNFGGSYGSNKTAPLFNQLWMGI